MKPLRLAALWLTLGWAYAAAIVFLSLTSSPPEGPDLPQIDKVFHLFAYFILMYWFMQIYEAKETRLIHLLIFLLMGAGLEILQGLSGIRHAEVFDMVANAAGVGVGFLLGQRFNIPLK